MQLDRVAETDLDELAAFAAPIQQRSDSHIIYIGTEVEGIRAELDETTWGQASVVARDADLITGWIIGDIDEEIGRVWWIGPFTTAPQWEPSATELLAAAREQLPDTVTQEEMAIDAEYRVYRAWAEHEGFKAEGGAYVLVLDGPLDPASTTVRAIEPHDHDVVARLHDELFPGTHTTGSQLVAGHDDDHRRLVIDDAGEVVGYIAVEKQPDGRGYIDYIGVAPASRRRGFAAELVRAGVAELRRLGAQGVGLTVREDSVGARELYASLGFREERLAIPLRLGFSLA